MKLPGTPTESQSKIDAELKKTFSDAEIKAGQNFGRINMANLMLKEGATPSPWQAKLKDAGVGPLPKNQKELDALLQQAAAVKSAQQKYYNQFQSVKRVVVELEEV